MTDFIGANDFQHIDNAEPDEDLTIELPVVPLRGAVILPGILTPITLEPGDGLAAAQSAVEKRQTAIMLGTTSGEYETNLDTLPRFATEVALGRLIPVHESEYSTLVQGRRRLEIIQFRRDDRYIVARARLVEESISDDSALDILVNTIVNLFEQVVAINDFLPMDILDYVDTIEDPGRLADFIVSTISISMHERQQILEELDLNARLRQVATLLTREINMLELRDEIDDQVQQEMERSQREFYLREQMRVIQDELGELDIFQEELDVVHEQIIDANLPDVVREKALQELHRLQMVPPIAPEVGMIRGYLDWIIALPWTNASEDNLDLERAQQILDAEHYGLPRVKDRILEHIAVRKLAKDRMKTPIMCFVGPPGVGKTSLGRSIARALGREFVRVSLGGVHDEAEIRGHRRTYIGAMPGRIIQTMRRAGTINPVFMLDEIDKLGADFRGDPASALLEALDPEQNSEYSDHYLDMDYDLSKAMFITTANDLYPLPEALLDRMEIIEFPSYTEEDKLQIARQFLIPEQLEANGVADRNIRFERDSLEALIRAYTYEAGVRNLNREVGAICRKLARLVAENKVHPKRIRAKHIEGYLGPPEFIALRANDSDSIGVATGVAWTPMGGDVLTIEASLMPGKGNMTLTGQLGDIMQESAQAALTYLRSRASDLNVPYEDFENYDVHIHLPEGAVPKDGPSAGITLATALISVFTERKIRADFSMTGEITLRGKVLPVGGIKEKLLAARRAQITNIILPEHNRKDLVDIPARALRDLNIVFVEEMQQVIDAVLLDPPAEGRRRDRDREEAEDESDDA